MHVAYLGTDVQMHSRNSDVLQGLDFVYPRYNLLIGDTELAVGLPGIDTFVGTGIDIGIDAEPHVLDYTQFRSYGIDNLQLLERLAIDGEDTLGNGKSNLFVAFAHSRIHDLLRSETRFQGAADLVTRGTVNTQP